MGNVLRPKRHRSIMVVGLDNSGKTTLLCNLKGVQEKVETEALAMGVRTAQTLPTSGMQLMEYETITPPPASSLLKLNEVTHWQIWDMSGQGRYRDMWKLYAGQVDGIIFVGDLTDGPRVAIAYKELRLLLQSERIRMRSEPMPIAFCCTKKELAEAVATGSAPSWAIDAGVTPGAAVDRLLEDEARKGLGVDALKNQGSNVAVLRWHFGEDIEAALEDIGRHLETQAQVT